MHTSHDARIARVLCAPDKLRDAATADQAAQALAAGAAAAGWEAVAFPIADGGEGTLEVVLAHGHGRVQEVEAVDALGRPSRVGFGLLPDATAVLVAADVVGLQPLAPEERDPMRTSSFGLAAPLLAAVAAGVRRLVIFVGGTANMDGGLGLLVGLGAEALDGAGATLVGTGRDLTRLAALDLSAARAAVADVEIVLASDVDSPLVGATGAAEVFAPQKGAAPEQVPELDAAMSRLSEMVGLDPMMPGAGAAGGLGYALLALGARRVPGAEMILEMSGFAAELRAVDLCLTAEGKVDRSTSAGKAVGAVLAASRLAGVPCVVLGGEVTPDAEALYGLGAAGVLSISRGARSLPEALGSATADLSASARAVCALVGSVMSST